VVLPACYELDAAKLLDFPRITDMRDPLTMRFQRAKLRADLLRPNTAEDLSITRMLPASTSARSSNT
jgi:hypothetical protein